MTPQYQHDCLKCVFLGRYDYQGEAYDLHACPQAFGGPTIIARWSSNGPDYMSGLSFGVREGSGNYCTPLQEAHARAVIGGHLPPTVTV